MAKLDLVFVCSMAFLFATAAAAEPNKMLYELQERCGKQASETFKNELGENVTKTSQGTTIASYENHYNARLNKCLYLEITTIIPQTKDRKMSKSLRLFDLHENRELVTYFRFDGSPAMQCEVADNSCHTEQEWRALVKPFMEE